MRQEERGLPLLALCAQRPGSPHISDRLRSALAAAPVDAALVDRAERHGMEALLLAHLRASGITVDAEIEERLVARRLQHAYAAAVRARLVAEAVATLEEAGIPLLVLKGAALSRLVYADAGLRPMRDVDLLTRERDAARAFEILLDLGYSPSGSAVPPQHHHLRSLSKTANGAIVTIELHHHLLIKTPLLASPTHDDLAADSQPFEWGGVTMRAPSPEDMLWHIHAHAFAIDPLGPRLRFISLADLVHATESWIDRIDWEALQERRGGFVRALQQLDRVTPWSPNVKKRLHVRPSSDGSLSQFPTSAAAGNPTPKHDLLWPPVLWIRLRYGVDGPRRWLWYRLIGHPLRIAIAAAASLRRKWAERSRRRGRELAQDRHRVS